MTESTSKIPTVFDTEEQHVGEVYARALLAAAASPQRIDLVVDQLESLVNDVLDRNPKLEVVLANPKTPIDVKWNLLDRVFADKMDDTLLKFLKVLAKRHRLTFVRAIQRAAASLRDEQAGRIRVQVTVPQALETAERTALVERLKAVFKKEIRLDTKVDPSIVGGLVIRIGDTVFDGSVDGQLRALRKTVGVRVENALRSTSADLLQVS